MASNIPIRRATRSTRAVKDIENANARPSRIVTRARAQAAANATGTSEVSTTRVVATTASSRAKAVDAATEKTAGKRKREILGEVVDPNKGKSVTKPSGKGKEKASTKADGTKSKTSTKAGPRVPLRQVGGTTTVQRQTRQSSSVSLTKPLKAVAEEGPVSMDLVVDGPSIPPGIPTKPSVYSIVRERAKKTQIPSLKQEEPILDEELDRPRVFKRRHTSNFAKEEPESPFISEAHLPVVDESQEEEDKVAAQLVFPEEEEEVELWDDLDAEDMDDPLMVAEYIVEIADYLKELEIKTLPTGDYMDFHAELDWEKRSIVLDWILQIHGRYHFLPESFFLCVNIVDRFLSLRSTVSLQKVQLVGVSCFCIAAKFEEGVAPSAHELVALTGGAYTTEEICKAERYVLKTLNYDLSYPGPMTWLRRGSKADDFETQARTIAKYLLEAACFEWRLVATPCSKLAAASLWLARLVLGREDWTPNLVHYTTFKEHELLPTASILVTYLLSPEQNEILYKKYASKRYMKCSVYMRKWVLDRFLPGAKINLKPLLAAIKHEIVEAREKERKLAEEEEF